MYFISLILNAITFMKVSHNNACQVAAERVQVLNAVRSKLPFLVTTGDDVKDSLKEEIRLR